jgi:transketolase
MQLQPFDIKNDPANTQKLLRQDIVKMAERSGHVAVALSCVDIIAALYGAVMNICPANIDTADRDHFILSKGHGCMALYAVLARAGFFSPELLDTYARNGSLLAEHPLAGKIPAIECATGTLGHGLAIAAGLAHGAKLQRFNSRSFVLMGDGECDEGSVWEAAALAANNNLDNLVAIIDWNGLQACGPCSSVSSRIHLPDCWRSFGWQVTEIDGHDYPSLIETFNKPNHSGQPLVILCRTIKGKGIDFMEGDLEWHYRPVNAKDRSLAFARLADA